MIEQITVQAAFGAGLLSFLSPCVLPMVPIYLGSLCGTSIFEKKSSRFRLPLMLHSLSFVLGFSAVFIILGALAGLTGLAVNPILLSRIAGALLIGFGLFILAAQKISWLNFERRVHVASDHAVGYLRSFGIGAAFSLGWTACVGPILAAILTLAAVRATALHGAYMLAIYSLGLGLPFLIIGAAFDSMLPLIRRINKYSRLIQIIGGFLLIGVGVLVLTNNVSLISSLGG
jgi:cytochrome c-type biogenesis protein